MDPLEPILTRRSVRRYLPVPVPTDLLERVLQAGSLAPTGMNLQPWEFVVVTEEVMRQEVGRYARYFGLRSHQVAEAPAVILICGHPHRSPMYVADCIFAGAMMPVAANALGLGSCWVGGFKEEPLKQILDIPAGIKLVGMITIGYADGSSPSPPKRDLEAVVHCERYGSARPVGLMDFVRTTGPLSVMRDLLRAQLRRR